MMPSTGATTETAKKVADPLTVVLEDLVRRGRAAEALAVLTGVSDADRRRRHLAEALQLAANMERPVAIADLLNVGATLADDRLDDEESASVARTLAGLADDTEILYAVLVRLSGRRLRELVRGCFLSGQEPLALRLLPHLSRVDEPLGPGSGATTTPLVLAAECGRPRLVVALLDRQATIEAEDAAGRTALAAACAAGQVEPVRLLLERGADPARADGEGRTCRQLLPVGSPSSDEIASLLAAAESLGSSRAERQQSCQLHGLMCRCGFTARRAELHSEAADFLLHRLARPLLLASRSGSVRLGGSFAEAWGACLVQANGRMAADSDVNWILTGGDNSLMEKQTPPQRDYSGIPISVDQEIESRPLNLHESARLSQLLDGRRCSEMPVGRTRDLPACFSDQERIVMRSLNTVQGQVFVILKIIFKRLLPSMGATGLTSYHAKTVLFFMLSRHSHRRSWWQPKHLLSLVRKTLELTLELLELDPRPCVCMPHYFAESCHLAFLNPAEDTKDRVRDAISSLQGDLPRINGFLRGHLRPLRTLQLDGRTETRVPLYFHPYTLLPQVAAAASDQRPCGEFGDAYRLVLRCLTALESVRNSQTSRATHVALLNCLPVWCLCARQCMIAMAHMRCGDRHRAAELLTLLAKHRVQRFWDMERCLFFGGLRGGTNEILNSCGDWGWRFCFNSDVLPAFQHLPQFTQSLLQPRSESPNRVYVNFRSVALSLTAELLPKHMVQLADWHAEMKYDPDYQELLTLAHYSDSPLHLNFCAGALVELRSRLRLDLSSEIEAVRSKLNRLSSDSCSLKAVTMRQPVKKSSSFKK